MTPLELMGLRFLIALPVLFGIILTKKARLDFRGDWKSLMAGSIVIALHFYVQITGIKYTSATNTGWIIAVTPLVMAVMAFLILKEKIDRRAIIGIITATIGIILLISKGHITEFKWLSSTGDWLVLASAHTWALYTIVIRDISRKQNPLSVITAMIIPSAALVLGIMVFSSDWGEFTRLPRDVILALLFLGVFGMALGHWFWQKGVSRIGAARAGIYLYLEPLATTALAVPYLGESFGIYTAFGGGLVLLGVWFARDK